MATIRDVASHAGVSIASVSRVLNRASGVSPAIARKVEAAITQLNYQPSDVARSLSVAATQLLACVIPDVSNPFFPELVRGVEDAAHQNGYMTLLCNTDDDVNKEAEYLRLLVRRRIDGLILIPPRDEPPPAAVLNLQSRGTPVVVVDRRLPGFVGDAVMVDNVLGGALAARHLLDLGHRRIGIISRAQDTSTAQDRQLGYEQELRKEGAFDPSLVRYGEFTLASGRQLAAELLHGPSRPTAILAGNDMVAIAVLNAARSLGLDVPRDLSVVGYDGIALAELIMPRLTTVAQPIYEIGRLAADLVVRRRKGMLSSTGMQHLLEPRLQLGGSTGRARS